jgi:hypothetical protein
MLLKGLDGTDFHIHNQNLHQLYPEANNNGGWPPFEFNIWVIYSDGFVDPVVWRFSRCFNSRTFTVSDFITAARVAKSLPLSRLSTASVLPALRHALISGTG